MKTLRGYGFRKALNRTVVGLCALACLLALAPLVSLIGYVLVQGLKGLNPGFFIHLPAPVGEPGGGMGNAILGTATLVALACLVGLPVGIMSGIYLAEFGKKGKLAWTVRYAADVLSGIPSIVIGIMTYDMIVRPMGHFSALAGGVALGLMMIPTTTRTTEELMKLVPQSLREASLALGASQARTCLDVVLRAARNGILTGVLLSVARVAGETAPLLFTAFNNQFWPSGINQPTASLTVQVFTYAISPFEDWHRQAWAGALVLMFMVLSLSASVRLVIKDRSPAQH